MTLRQLSPDASDLMQVLDLIRAAFAYMDGRVDPPSSMHRLTIEDLRHSAATGEVWVIGDPVGACVVLTPYPDRLYLGKLATHPQQRKSGLARQLVDRAVQSARERGLGLVELQVRVELTENIDAFERLGFRIVRRSAHDGYDRPTSVTMHREVTGNGG